MFTHDESRERSRTVELLNVARRYYLDGATQAEISRAVGYSRPTVSRMLQEAREQGVVQIEIGHPLERLMHIEHALVERFGLTEARVTDAGAGDPLALLAARYVSEITSSASVIAVSNGSTVSDVVDAFPQLHRPDSLVVQMIGTLGQANQMLDSPDLCRRLSDSIGGTYRIMPAPLVVANARLATALRREDSVATAIALGGRADVALLGIGATNGNSSGPIFDGWMTHAVARELTAAGAVGHICGHHFDINGNHVVTDLCRRVMSVPLDRLRDIPRVVAVAAGTEKTAAIRAALRGKHADVLVTDVATARAVLAAD